MALASEAQAQIRKAFIVGIGEYEELTDLRKTVGDADGYSDVFQNDLGFLVTRVEGGQKRRDFIAAFDSFVSSINPGDEVAFVFSGHGWSNGSENYLALSDTPLGVSQAVLVAETVALERMVMARLRAQEPKLIFAIIDACRDEKYGSLTKGGSLEKGITRISANDGELILYSAGAGQTSLDRLSDLDPSPYSVFTRALLPRLSDATRPLATIADETRAEVRDLANKASHIQNPAMMLGIDLSFCLALSCSDSRLQYIDADTDLWLRVTRTSRTFASCQGYHMYLTKFPVGVGQYSARAQELLHSPPCAEPLLAQPSVSLGAPAILDANAPGALSPAPLIGSDPKSLPDFSLFRECGLCPDMVVLPSGNSVMGSPVNEDGHHSDEGPLVTTGFNEAFAVGRFEVTWDQWNACVAAGSCKNGGLQSEGSDEGWGLENRPVINVSWFDAKAYADWVSLETGGAYRLLTEDEWEYAARANSMTAYWWGPSIGLNRANCNGCNSLWDNIRTAPTGMFRPNKFGLYDMNGNVWEWVENCYSLDLNMNDEQCIGRVVRGGSWASQPESVRSANRDWNVPEYSGSTIGFRLARTL
ncbi:MAG: SUMF1/EgtB/PvdO family nonheme iron enzyme [Hyphomonadaceae bacterium]